MLFHTGSKRSILENVVSRRRLAGSCPLAYLDNMWGGQGDTAFNDLGGELHSRSTQRETCQAAMGVPRQVPDEGAK